MKNKKVLFLIPDGVGIRNYLYSNVLNYVKQDAAIAIWSNLPEKAFTKVKELHAINIEYKNLKLNPESLLTRLFKEAATYGRLLSNSKKVSNITVLNNWRKENKNFKLRQLYSLAEKMGMWSSKKYSRILSLEEKAQKYWKRSIIESYKKDLGILNPTSIFITHQRVSSLMPVCIAAKELGIPVITAIYSWDNLPKGRLAVQADKYIVWSDYMKDEMKIYYPEINQEKVLVTGTPQFEFYFKKQLLLSKNDFAQKFGLDSTKTWICFSGDDTLTSPNDQMYLRDVASALGKNSKLSEIQIIFRRCPVDFSARYDDVLKDSKSIVSINPEWYTSASGWNSFFPKFSDVSLLVNTASHCALVINVGSTMSHDFAVLNKPCLYINYNIKNQNLDWSTDTIYKFQHFRTMQNLEAVGWLNSSEEIGEKIIKALENPAAVGKDRKKWLEKIVQHPLQESSKNIANVLLNYI
jgi:hypothetical protein